MQTYFSAKTCLNQRLALLSLLALVALPGSWPSAVAAGSRVLPSVKSAQPAGAGIALTVGLTPNGDGSTCGTATSVQVNVGDLVDFCYTVTNHSASTLAYHSLGDSADGELFAFSPSTIPPGGSYIFHRQIHPRATSVHQATWTARSDLYRYTYDDTRPVDFADISEVGTIVDMDGWGAEKRLDLPFPFALFGGSPVTSICVSNMGYIRTEVATCAGQYGGVSENPALPVTYEEGNHIAPYWDLLDDVMGGVYMQVRGNAPERQFIVQWNRSHAVFYGPTYDPAWSQGSISVEAIFGEDGSLAFQYQRTTFDYVDWLGVAHPELDNGRSATIGLSASLANGGNAAQYGFNTAMPHPAPSSIVWSPDGLPDVYTAQASVEIDVGGPLIVPSPTLVATAAAAGSSAPVSATLSIGNAGDRTLQWSIAEGSTPAGYRAVPTRRAVVARDSSSYQAVLQDAGWRSAVGAASTNGAVAAGPAVAAPQDSPCASTTPGVIIHDDGVATNGYAGGVNVLSTAIDKFTPAYYPITLASVCVAFATYDYPTSPAGAVDYEVVVYDDTGPGGTPGNELGSVSASTTGAAYPQPGVFRDSVDISSLGISIASGSVYVGARWNPDQSPAYTVFLDADENGSDGAPLDPPEGGYFDGGDGVFVPTPSLFGDYKAMMVRAVETAPGCTRLEDVPWLMLSATSGIVAPGAAPSAIGVTLDPTGLAAGTHTANICVSSGEETVAVPVVFSIGSAFPVAALGSSAINFSLAQGDTGDSTLTITNAGTSDSLLHYVLDPTAAACGVVADVGWLRVQPAEGWVSVGQPATVTVHADSAGLAGGPHTAVLCVTTNSAAQSSLSLPVTLVVQVPDAVFADGFESLPNTPAVYRSRDEFLTHVRVPFYEENFNGVPANELITDPMTFANQGFSYSLFTQSGATSGLYDWPNVISHNASTDQIVVTFITPVTAVGGNFWETNSFGEESNGPIWLTLSDGTFLPLGGTSRAGTFAGFITASPITSLTIDSPNGNYTWATLDNLVIGNKN